MLTKAIEPRRNRSKFFFKKLETFSTTQICFLNFIYGSRELSRTLRNENPEEQNGGNPKKRKHRRTDEEDEIDFESFLEKKIWTISRFVRVILAQGPC